MTFNQSRFLIIAVMFLNSFGTAGAKPYDIPEIEASLSLSGKWMPVSQTLVKKYNDDMLLRRPQTRTRYIAGFTRGTPTDGSDLGNGYFWIQMTPTPGSTITPEQLTSMLPKEAAASKKEFERLLKDRIASVDPGSAHYEQRLGAVVYESAATLPDGSVANLRSYLIVTKPCVISINGYTTPANAEAVFEEIQGIVSTLNLKEDQKMPLPWLTRLKELMGENH